MKQEVSNAATDLPVDPIVVNDICQGGVELEHQEQAGQVECGGESP